MFFPYISLALNRQPCNASRFYCLILTVCHSEIIANHISQILAVKIGPLS